MHKVFLTETDILKPVGLKDFASAVAGLHTKTSIFAIYTCGTYAISLAVVHNKLLVIDTHPVSKRFGGNGEGLLKIYPDHSYASGVALGKWMALGKGNKPSTQAKQSLMIISEVVEKRYVMFFGTCICYSLVKSGFEVSFTQDFVKLHEHRILKQFQSHATLDFFFLIRPSITSLTQIMVFD